MGKRGYTFVFLTDDDKEDILRMHGEGSNCYEIAEYIGCTPPTVWKYLKRMGRTVARNNQRTVRKMRDVVRDYNDGMNYKELAVKYGYRSSCSCNTAIWKYKKSHPELFTRI